jgi:hypothetical protein
MPLVTPNLDDRSFEALLQSAKDKVRSNCSGWTDLSASDPGTVLLEAFSFLTETMIYRLNRVPRKVYIEFLKLLGLTLQPPAGAVTTLQFTRLQPGVEALLIPQGTRVTASRNGPSGVAPIFSTLIDVEIPAGALTATVQACQCELVRAEKLGVGNGQSPQRFRVAQQPILAGIGEDSGLVVAVEDSRGASTADDGGRVPTIPLGGKQLRVWREVSSFAEAKPNDSVYVVDRESGLIEFAPAQRAWKDQVLDGMETPIAAVPPLGAEIRVWYRHGGGPLGSVPPGALTVLKDTQGIPLTVTNLTVATGGNAAETLEHALVRGPRELHALERAVTASDFELLALRSAAVDRAKAFTQAARWRYAVPGTVEIVLLPRLPIEPPAAGTTQWQQIVAQRSEDTRTSVLEMLNARRPMGSTCVVSWANCKPVRVEAAIEAYPEEDKVALQGRLIGRLNDLLSPFDAGRQTSWRFGRSLAVSDVYDACLREPGVRQVSALKLVVESAPDTKVRSLVTDPFHAGLWYAVSETGLFRTENNGDGWELLKSFSEETGARVTAHRGIPGLLALCSNLGDGSGMVIRISMDCGETWNPPLRNIGPQVNDAEWITRGGTPLLMLATDQGLYELATDPGAAPLQVQVRQGDQGFHSIASIVDAKGVTYLAVAARNKGGVFLSSAEAASNSFHNLGLAGEDVQKLAMQRSGSRTFLWAGFGVDQIQDNGTGCKSWELLGESDSPDGWVIFAKGWVGGSCTALSFAGDTVLAGSYDGGLLMLPGHVDNAVWRPADVRSGLPRGTTKEQLLERIDTVAATPDLSLIMTGGLSGLYLSSDRGVTYSLRSARSSTDFVTLPVDWLFCAANHAIDVRSGDEISAG